MLAERPSCRRGNSRRFCSESLPPPRRTPSSPARKGSTMRERCAWPAAARAAWRAVEQPYHVRDLHATILHQLGLEQEELTFLHNGREEMLTDIGGQLLEGIL